MTTREERKNLKSAIFMIVMAIVSLLFLFFIGIPLVGRFTAYLNSMRSSTNPNSNDATPPAPPKFNNFPDFTNQKTIDLTGSAESGSTVKLTFNGDEKQNLTDKSGKFTFNVELTDKENSFSAITTDPAGNVSKETDVYTITYDDKAPEVSVTKPSDGENLFGSTQRQLTIEGQTDPETQITINDRFVTVESSGKFSYTLTMVDGQNTFNVKAVDKAGNATEKSLTVNYSL